MTNLRDRIIAEALAWEDIPYVHGQSTRWGTDCIGYIIGIAKGVGVLAAEYLPPPYPRDWHHHNTRELMKEHIEKCGGIPVATPVPGDILLFRFALAASHAAILLPDNWMIHAVLNKRVIRQRYTAAWQRIYDCAYQFPGVL